jgi:pilus assembly protein Flp/PilA
MGRLDIVASLRGFRALMRTPLNLREDEAAAAPTLHLEPGRFAGAVLRRNSLCAKASPQNRVCSIELTPPKELGSHGHRVKDGAERGDLTPDGVLFMKNLIARFAKDESGATAIEYGLIAAGIALAIITVVNNLGTTLNTKFTSISSSLK